MSLGNCKNCGSPLVVGYPDGSYERCLACHHCYSYGKPIGETPTNFRILDDELKNSEVIVSKLMNGKTEEQE